MFKIMTRTGDKGPDKSAVDLTLLAPPVEDPKDLRIRELEKKVVFVRSCIPNVTFTQKKHPVKAKNYIFSCTPVVNKQAVPSRSTNGMLQFEDQSLLANFPITSLFVPENPVPFSNEQVSMEVDAPVDNLQQEQNVPNVQNQENQPHQVEEILKVIS
uniref:Uncharacterized protein n=1 Tax=Ditylenchus dipsaci TaxID=166011 RepID=A0A915E4X0_9BILA